MESKPGDLEGLAQSAGKAIEKDASTTITSASKPDPIVEDVPDPDEDDLDDLDDMLDEFSPSKPESKAHTLPTGPGRPQSEPATAEEGISDDDFAKQLQAGMADLLGELDTSPEMQAQFEVMMKELGGAAALGGAADTAPLPPAVPSLSKPGPSTSAGKIKETDAEKTFQETIKKTMERMQASGDQATAAAASDNTDDILAEMMKAMQAGGLDGEAGEEDFSKMLLGMMEQLTNKEILYEPMKELDDKFPEWMEKNKGKVKEDDMKRYNEQQVYVREIVGRFEQKTYTDENAADREYIVERMQKMQAAGSPPQDLVGDMAAAQEAFGAPEEGCSPQ
ncbi:Peroxisomal farnesylated [Hyphodiscus hymeniophilus]|uniref:Peroxisomal farnesylated n=1 Tax=Hyphodiscus hymeniophilus TaxID=353542 RepID=A0A9P6VQ40_9HELO|nr:Peroxisomal farnesylated [Hyphodiscus hymeniophilus]